MNWWWNKGTPESQTLKKKIRTVVIETIGSVSQYVDSQAE